jgi:ornithine carbamoyltransferase
MSSEPTLRELLEPDSLRGRDILGIKHLTADEIRQVLQLAAFLKTDWLTDAGPELQSALLARQTAVMIFEKPSLRTRASFDQAMYQLGGRAIDHDQLLDGQRELTRDIARCLHGYYQAIIARTFSYEAQEELAKYSRVPVINGLDDQEHPCQAFADFQTLMELFGAVEGVTLAYLGDANNNVLHSLLLMAAKLGTNINIACPTRYEPDKAIMELARAAARTSGAQITVVQDPRDAVRGVQAVYTDTHVSMGRGARDQRLKDLAGYMVTADLMALADRDAVFLHCLPAYREQEVTNEVLEGPQSKVFDQAENRLHAQKALLALVLRRK